MASSKISFLDGSAEKEGRRFDTVAAILPDGATVTRLESHGPGVIYNYEYCDQIFRFNFFASRWSEDTRPLDFFKVFFLRAEKLSERERRALNPAELQRVKTNLEAAFLAWPPAKAEAVVKITRVEIHTDDWDAHAFGRQLRTGN
jgi:hypothetical protein